MVTLLKAYCGTTTVFSKAAGSFYIPAMFEGSKSSASTSTLILFHFLKIVAFLVHVILPYNKCSPKHSHRKCVVLYKAHMRQFGWPFVSAGSKFLDSMKCGLTICFLKIPESSPKQNLNSLCSGNYLHIIYIVFTSIYIAFALYQVL